MGNGTREGAEVGGAGHSRGTERRPCGCWSAVGKNGHDKRQGRTADRSQVMWDLSNGKLAQNFVQNVTLRKVRSAQADTS